MKRVFFIIPLLCLLIAACNGPELTQQEAARLISEQRNFPRTVDFDVFCGDPEHARLLLNAGLEEQGLVTIKRTRSFMDTSPFITFTEKATPYLLPTPEKDKKIQVQKVKIAVENIDKIELHPLADSPNSVIVEYTTKRSQQTPFAVLYAQKDPNKKQRITMIRTETGWLLEKAR